MRRVVHLGHGLRPRPLRLQRCLRHTPFSRRLPSCGLEAGHRQSNYVVCGGVLFFAFVEGVSPLDSEKKYWQGSICHKYQIRLADRASVFKFSRHEHPEGQTFRGSPNREPFFEATLSEVPDSKSSFVEKTTLCSVRLRIGGMSVPGPPGAG